MQSLLLKQRARNNSNRKPFQGTEDAARDRLWANRYSPIPSATPKKTRTEQNPLRPPSSQGSGLLCNANYKTRKREQWRLHTNRRRHPRKANGLKALLKCPYYQSEFRVNVLSTHKALVFFTKQKMEDGNGVTGLLFQHLGTGSRRISSSNTAWLHPAYEVSLGYTERKGKEKKLNLGSKVF